jgi:hypothetical protein
VRRLAANQNDEITFLTRKTYQQWYCTRCYPAPCQRGGRHPSPCVRLMSNHRHTHNGPSLPMHCRGMATTLRAGHDPPLHHCVPWLSSLRAGHDPPLHRCVPWRPHCGRVTTRHYIVAFCGVPRLPWFRSVASAPFRAVRGSVPRHPWYNINPAKESQAGCRQCR